MIRLLLGRLASALPVAVLASFLAFSLIHLLPSDAAIIVAGENASAEQIEAARVRLGLDRPFHAQYLTWVTNVLKGDFGSSFYSSREVLDEIAARLPATVSLAALSILIGVALGLVAGAVAGYWSNSWVDRTATVIASVGMAVPNFWWGGMLILIFAVRLRWLPSTGYVDFRVDMAGWLRHLLLPALTIATAIAAIVARQARASLQDILRRPYIRSARARGLSEPVVVAKHAAKNAAIPVVTVVGVETARLIGGAVVVIEFVFGLPGIGNLAVTSVYKGDIPMLQGLIVITASFVLLVNLIVDLSYRYFSPRTHAS